MRFATVAVLSALAAVASAVNQTVAVGMNGTLTFTPNNVNASSGDTINFVFMSKNHTVTQSTFGSPCTQKADGFDSSFLAVNTTDPTQFPSWSITLTSTDPLWVYCRQAQHCGAGMVLAINASPDKTFDEFLATAKATLNGTATTNGTSASGTASAGPSATSAIGTPLSTVGGASATGSSGAASPSTPASGAVSVRGATGLLTVVAVVMGLVL